MYDAVLLVAFGGPRSPDEIAPFLAHVTEGRNIPPERLEEVRQNYLAVGGRSPLVEITFRQAKRLEAELWFRGHHLPVYVGMRNWHPFLHDTLAIMQARRVHRAVGIILSPQRSPAGWDRYVEDVAAARTRIGRDAPVVDLVPSWHKHEGFHRAVACRVAQTLAQVAEADRPQVPLIFTAHSLPVAMASKSPYVEQLENSAREIAARLRHEVWRLAFQSRSGPPSEPWLEPDISQCIAELARSGAKTVVVAPIGFVADHVEILYDLDVAARATAEQNGVQFLRAGTVGEHPAFIGMLADLVVAQLADG
ncbi:MAG: ferrochelatase [Candidatus Binatia bacterium]|nr:MAG: ferrochelatase [Candidatus Binatia bacterium]